MIEQYFLVRKLGLAWQGSGESRAVPNTLF